MMSLSLDEPRPIDSRGRASPPGEASSGELSGELILCGQLLTSLRYRAPAMNIHNDLVAVTTQVSIRTLPVCQSENCDLMFL